MIFAIVGDYATGHQLQSLVQTVVAIFLPLSGMWASAQTNDDKVVRPDARFHRAIPVGATDLSSAKAYGSTKTTDTTLVENDFDSDSGRYQYTAASSDRGKMTIRSTSSPHGAVHFHPQGFDFGTQNQTPSNGNSSGGGKTSFSEDLEMQRFRNEGVVVDRTYSVRSD